MIQSLEEKIISLAKKEWKNQVKWRRHLHQYPEIANEEFKTTAFLRRQLKKSKIKLLPLKMPTGLLAEVTGNRKHKLVAIRTDIDALPVTEETGLRYCSKIKGKMHACGHDVHMATVLGVASILNQLRDELPGRVRFLFQPAEEKPPGGARPMIACGALKDVEMIFGLHVDPNLKVGQISLRNGPTMASVYDFDLEITGQAGHAARPHNSIDAICVACEIVQSMQKIISREIDPINPAVITFGMIEGGTARNVIADYVKLTGTSRTLSPSLFKRIPDLIQRTAAGICKAHGASFKMNEVASYPVLSNSISANSILRDSYAALFNRKEIKETEVVLGGEDFACYLQKIPGGMFRLGIKNKKIGADKSWHSSRFIVDEDAIMYGTALLVMATFNYLNKK